MSKTIIKYDELKLQAKKEKRQLGDILHELKNGKKCLCFYGNCQISTMYRLANSSELINEYVLFSFGSVHLISGEEELSGFPISVLHEIDVLICQNVYCRGGKIKDGLKTERIIQNLRPDASVIRIPNIYFRGYFPQFCANPYNVVLSGLTNKNGVFPWGDCNINCLSIDHTAEEISKIISDPDFYTSEEVCSKAMNSLKELKEREAFCDVKISDYIEDNFQKEQLLFGVNHPQAFVMHVLLSRVFRLLDVSFHPKKVCNGEENTGRELLIYPSVQKHLKLRFSKKKYYYYKTICDVPVDILGYVRAYLFYCGEKIRAAYNNE